MEAFLQRSCPIYVVLASTANYQSTENAEYGAGCRRKRYGEAILSRSSRDFSRLSRVAFEKFLTVSPLMPAHFALLSFFSKRLVAGRCDVKRPAGAIHCHECDACVRKVSPPLHVFFRFLGAIVLARVGGARHRIDFLSPRKPLARAVCLRCAVFARVHLCYDCTRSFDLFFVFFCKRSMSFGQTSAGE